MTNFRMPIFIFSCAVCAAFLLMRFCVLPQWNSFTHASSRCAVLRSAVASENSGAHTQQTLLLEKQNALEQKYGSIVRESGISSDLSSILRMIIDMANKSGIQFVQIVPQTEIANDTSGSYPVVLDVVTTYNNLGLFVSNLESKPAVFHVDRMAITAKKQKEELDIKILVTCHIQKQDVTK